MYLKHTMHICNGFRDICQIHTMVLWMGTELNFYCEVSEFLQV